MISIRYLEGVFTLCCQLDGYDVKLQDRADTTVVKEIRGGKLTA